jgi:phage baseplate assembly protein W
MPGLAPRLPLEKDPEDGFGLIKTYAGLIKQNLRNLVLTAPGERMMDPEFGVGIRNYLFGSPGDNTSEEVQTAIAEQVSRYMSFVELVEINISLVEDSQIMHVALGYRVPSIGVADRLSIQASLRNNEITAI